MGSYNVLVSIIQKSFSDLGYANNKTLTRRDRFLPQIEKVSPWDKLQQLIEPFYPKIPSGAS
jgi:transposase, IS5 family